MTPVLTGRHFHFFLKHFMASKINEPEALNNAKAMLMLPDYFNYRLTGVMKQEYTNACGAVEGDIKVAKIFNVHLEVVVR